MSTAVTTIDDDQQPGHPRPDQAAARRLLERAVDDGVLGEEADEGYDAGQRAEAERHRHERVGQLLAQAAHRVHRRGAADRVDDRAGGEEQQRLERAVRQQVQHRGGPGAGRSAPNM